MKTEQERLTETTMLSPQRVMETALQLDYSISRKTRKRYAEMLVARAVRFYIQNNLDQLVVSEDLYRGDDFDCGCSQESADTGRHESLCEYSKKDWYPNLKDGEDHERRFQKEQGALLK